MRKGLSLAISLEHYMGAFWAFALEPMKLPFILSGICSPNEANYSSNPFEVFFFCILQHNWEAVNCTFVSLKSKWTLLNNLHFVLYWKVIEMKAYKYVL